MNELKKNIPPGTSDEPGPDEIFSKVKGNDKYGNADLYGLGVQATDLWGVTPSRIAYIRENRMMKSRIEELEAKKAQLIREKNRLNSDSTISPVTSPVVEPPPLRSIHKPFDIVARRWVLSLDPKEVVGGKEIGSRYCSVNPQVAIQKDEELVRPYGHMDTIIDALGTPIAWSRNFIEMKHI
ncbi:uncharacterized protein [Rutidosis leptorrhynchoides]|uniref:uncharacterized protein n=1 Tax=Rutidosis leptorrhynchoides TaxID=125765 RepID=UPI003A9994D7